MILLQHTFGVSETFERYRFNIGRRGGGEKRA
jgi:hypothetical protein